MEQEFFVLTKTVAVSRSHVKRDNPQISVNRKRLPRVDYAFVPVAENAQDDIASPTLRDFFCRVLMGFWRRGISNPPIRLLMAKMKKSRSQIKRYIRELVALGKMTWRELKVSHNRNAPNIYTPTACVGGVGFINEPERKGEVLKTTTRAPTAAGVEVKPTITPKPSVPGLQWALRKAHDVIASLRMRGEYADRGKLWERSRMDKAYERNRMALQARVGMAPTPTVFDPVAHEAYLKRERERELSPLEKARRHNGGMN